MLFELDSENSDILNNLDYFNLNKNEIENKYKYINKKYDNDKYDYKKYDNDKYDYKKYDNDKFDFKKYDFNYNNYDVDFNNYVYDKNKRIVNVDLEKGFYLGNIFIDSYDGYKNYKAKKINAYSEQQKMLLRIYELDFILNDLNLYLDINPNDKRLFEIFKKCAMELDVLKKKYYEKYQVLELCKDTKDKYTWISNPWPWDGGYYV